MAGRRGRREGPITQKKALLEVKPPPAPHRSNDDTVRVACDCRAPPVNCYLSLSNNEEQRECKRKMSNAQCLAKRRSIVCLSETHVDGIMAKTLFCSSTEGTYTFYDDDMAVLVDDHWRQRAQPSFLEVSPSVMVAPRGISRRCDTGLYSFDWTRVVRERDLLNCSGLLDGLQTTSGHLIGYLSQGVETLISPGLTGAARGLQLGDRRRGRTRGGNSGCVRWRDPRKCHKPSSLGGVW